MADKFQDDYRVETYKSMISISVEGFKILALLNGGAAAGILAAFDKVRMAVDAHSLKIAIFCFVAGLSSVGLAFFASYLTQNALLEESLGRQRENSHVKFYRAAMGFCGVSLVAFVAGATFAAFGIH